MTSNERMKILESALDEIMRVIGNRTSMEDSFDSLSELMSWVFWKADEAIRTPLPNIGDDLEEMEKVMFDYADRLGYVCEPEPRL
jgi:hypothetical protein